MAKAIYEALLDGPYTVDDFLAWEREQPERFEYVGGVVRMMVGGTLDHNVIAGNIYATLRIGLKGGPCRAFVEAVKVRSDAASMYPDVVISCAELEHEAEVLSEPVIVFEVLSRSTQGYDMGDKWLAYQTIPSLRQYIMVAQTRLRVDCYERTESGWHYRTLEGPDAILSLAVSDLQLTMAAIYEGSALDSTGST